MLKKTLIYTFAYISLICDLRASININAEILNNLFSDNKLRRLIRVWKQLISNIRTAYNTVIKARDIKLFDYYKYIKDQISSRKTRRCCKIDRLQRRVYFKDINTEKIKQQFNNFINKIEYIELTVQYKILKYYRLIELLCNFRTNLIKKQIVQRYIEIIINIIAFC